MVIYSHSKLSTFEKCPTKYKFKYINKLTPDYDQSIEAFLGKKVHETLEWVYQYVNEQAFELDDLIKHYIESWNRDFNNEIKIVKADLTPDYYFNRGIKFIINYFLSHSPFKDNTIETEKRIYVNLGKNGEHKLIGYIDRLVHHKETNVFEIHDYKTGYMPSQEELDNDRQLALYSLAIHDLFDDVNDVHLIWHFLDHNEKKVSKRTYNELEHLKEKTIEMIKKIESTTNFDPNPTQLCKWCEFRTYCPVIKENPNYPDEPIQIRKDTIKKDIAKSEINKEIFEF